MDMLKTYRRFNILLALLSAAFFAMPYVYDSVALLYCSIWWAVFIIIAFLSSYMSYDGGIIRRMFILYLQFELWLNRQNNNQNND